MNAEQRCVKHGEQLAELLLAMAIAMVLAGLALQLLIQVWNETRDTYREVTCLQEIGVFRKAWRNFAEQTAQPFVADNSGLDLRAGSCRATITPEGALLLTSQNRRRRLVLPETMTAILGTSASSDGASLAILTLHWTCREGTRVSPRWQRIVATGRRERS